MPFHVSLVGRKDLSGEISDFFKAPEAVPLQLLLTKPVHAPGIDGVPAAEKRSPPQASLAHFVFNSAHGKTSSSDAAV